MSVIRGMVEAMSADADFSGLEVSRYAAPNCKVCGGSGRLMIGSRVMRQICQCVMLGYRLADIEEIRGEVFHSNELSQMNFENYNSGESAKNELALRTARNFVDHWATAREEGWIIAFRGLPSAGKTHLAVSIAQALLGRYMVVPMIVNLPTQLGRERERYNVRGEERTASWIDAAIEAEFLVLDDLGSERIVRTGDGDVSWVQEQIYQVLDGRIMANRPFVYTTNLTETDLRRHLGEDIAGQRIWERLERAQASPTLEVVRVPGMNRQNESAAALLTAEPSPLRKIKLS